ncbi:tubby-like protein 8 isoform X2 [Quercus robur]|uniref:tubby-like protein 8 isoform X2 n=1 Tax=Quercus robur TaxID=38942 RepID=UPI002163B0CD|nr:tubby-like protein 8 isoform X2 [Quercus robur]
MAMMSVCKKSSMPRQSSYNSLYVNPLNDQLKHNRSCSEGGTRTPDIIFTTDDIDNIDKENDEPNTNTNRKHKQNANGFAFSSSISNPINKSLSTNTRVLVNLKPSSLQFCMQMNEPDKAFFPSKVWEPPESENSSSLNIWDYSDSEAAPASSWSTLPNRSLLCRPLPLDIGRCTCVIVKEEASPEGLHRGTLYSLYTNEGQGRQDRKLAVAHHKRYNGKSEFTIAQNTKGIVPDSDDNFIGGRRLNSQTMQSKSLLAVVRFMPTVATCTGSYRSMMAYIPKQQFMQLKNANQVQHIYGLPKDWEGKVDHVHELFSRVPNYSKISKQYELDYRDRGRAGLRIQSSVKNFQLTLEENGKQSILQLGRVGKSKYVMDYRYPLTGFQAFCICLASIDTKLCCIV